MRNVNGGDFGNKNLKVMQTFLPYAHFMKSARVLDKKRCWKQVIEARQIIDVLQGKQVAWKNHPAVLMWDGSIDILKHYYNIFLYWCIMVHNINTKMQYMENSHSFISDGELYINNLHLYPGKGRDSRVPWWLGNEDFHRAMRARLIEKDKDFYLPKFPDDEGFNDGKYLWPVMKTKTFRTI